MYLISKEEFTVTGRSRHYIIKGKGQADHRNLHGTTDQCHKSDSSARSS